MQKKKIFFVSPLAWAALAALAGANSAARAATFTPGDIVVLEGDNQNTDTGTVPAFIDEYTPSGTLVTQVAVPTSTVGSTNALTLSNVSGTSHEGVLTRSENGQYLTFGGYDTGPGNTSALSTGTGTVGIIGSSMSSLNTSTTLASGNQNVRAATTIDGNEYYVAEAHGTSTTGGLNYVSGSGPTATQTNINGSLDARSAVILGGSNPSTGVLVAGSGSSSFSGFGGSGHGVYGLQGSIGGLPTSSSITGTQINGDASDGSDVVFVNEPGNLNGSYHGYNTMYLSGNTSSVAGFIEKYTWNGTTFAPDGAIVDTTGTVDPIGLTVQPDATLPATEDVFYTEPSGIYELTAPDLSGSTFNSSTSTLVASPGANAYFYGIASAPVPEPASLGLLLIGSLGLLSRRRRVV